MKKGLIRKKELGENSWAKSDQGSAPIPDSDMWTEVKQ